LCFDRTPLTVFLTVQPPNFESQNQWQTGFDDNHGTERETCSETKAERKASCSIGLPLRISMLLLETFQRSDRDQQVNSGTVQRRRKIEMK
jgi:hypothetical protein